MSEDEPGATRRIDLGGTAGWQVELRSLSLRVLSGPQKHHQQSFSLPVVRIGASRENDFVLAHASVSRHHAELRLTDAGALLRDLDSTNGTWVAGVKIREADLRPGMRVRLGEVELEVAERTATHQGVVEERSGLGHLVGRSPAMLELYGLLEAVAPSDATVLLGGQSGAGKELVARTLHELSGRKGPLVVFDAATSDPQMIRSDLFGHVKGAFTGAEGPRDGAFRKAEGGTLFLDEIGELPLDMQPRLLRALENREVQPVGSDATQRVNVRVVAATHRDLKAMADAGSFRKDLFHRLSVVRVTVPRLGDRLEDVPLLIAHFCRQLGVSLDLSPEAEVALCTHPWPGNVRQLRNQIERLGALCRGRPVGLGDLDLGEDEGLLPAPVDQERMRIEIAMKRHRGNKTRAAAEAGVSLSTLKRRLREYAAEAGCAVEDEGDED